MKKSDIQVHGNKAVIDDGKHRLIMDAEDAHLLHGWCIGINTGGYARLRREIKGKRVSVSLHRLVTNAPKGMDVDHVNHNTLDNRKANLRICTRSENARNNKGHKGRASRYKGVYFDKWHKGFKNRGYLPWRAYTRVMGKRIWLGYYATQEEAGQAYNEYAAREFGEFAYLNEIPLKI